jgi:protoporphyrinogen oxidase
VVRECLMGFIATLANQHAGPAPHDRSFKEWILDNLGEGMAKHFMLPFNEKLWQISLDELTSDWVSWLVPKPELKDVVNGALGIKDKAFGYNPSFLYPAQGGINVLPESFVPGIAGITHSAELVEVDTKRRRAIFHDPTKGGTKEERYESLISTIPIPELIHRCIDFPAPLKDAAAALRWVSVYNINLGIGREQVSDKHWIYFPEAAYPFYRAGFPMNFSPSLGRPGCSSMYVEMSHKPTEHQSAEQLIGRVRSGLEQADILRPDDELVVSDVKDLQYAYVYFDHHRAQAIPALLTELERRGIYSVGRYGRWEHTSMEDAIGQGKQIAERLRTQYGYQASA